MGRRSLLGLLFVWSSAAFAASPADFTPRCAAAMQGVLPKGRPTEIEAFCSCTETRARTDGATEKMLLDYVDGLERDPKGEAPPAIQRAASACFEKQIRRVNDQAREDYERSAAARNRSRAHAAYRWTAWIRSGGPLQELELSQDEWEGEVGGVTCRLQEARTRERRDGALWVRDVIRTLDCPGAEVTFTGTEITPGHTGCSHTRDGKLGIEGRARFEVRPRSGDVPGGSFMLACDRIDG
jgi:hypothetical protein